MINVNHTGIIASSQTSAGGGAFTPIDITSATLEAWYDPSDASTITESSGLVSQLDDKSVNGRDVLQGTGSLQPETGTRTIGGVNVLDCLADRLVAASSFSLGSANFTTVSILSPDALDPFDAPWGGNGFSTIQDVSTGKWQISSAATASLDSSISLGDEFILVCRRVSNIMTFYIGGADNGAVFSSIAGALSIQVFGNRQTAGSNGWEGMIGEQSFYTGSISDSELNQLGNAYATKYGLTWSDI